MLCKVAQVFAREGRPIVLFAFIPFSGKESSYIRQSICTHSSYLIHATASADYSCGIVSLSYKAVVHYLLQPVHANSHIVIISMSDLHRAGVCIH